jgi:quinol monooxygenase YgiN
MPGCVHLPWYATAFRGDRLEEALGQIAPVALRYGGTSYHVYRYRDDRYKFLQVATFEDKLDWERYWGGPEFTRWRALHNGWYQVPIVYQWTDIAAEGSLPRDPVASGAPSSLESPGDPGDTF